LSGFYSTSSFGGRLVIIAVGPNKTKFYIHEQVAAHAGIDDFDDIFTPLKMITLFRLYVVAHNYLVYGIQDIIMSHLFFELGGEWSVWSEIGSDKKAIECFVADVPESSHLYRLVVRAMAYSMLQPTSAHNDNKDLCSDGNVFHELRIPANTRKPRSRTSCALCQIRFAVPSRR
jgi:hypothetical protein